MSNKAINIQLEGTIKSFVKEKGYLVFELNKTGIDILNYIFAYHNAKKAQIILNDRKTVCIFLSKLLLISKIPISDDIFCIETKISFYKDKATKNISPRITLCNLINKTKSNI
jgi:hypothetical protein